jgi:DNA-binding XRE family transcriptional regulator
MALFESQEEEARQLLEEGLSLGMSRPALIADVVGESLASADQKRRRQLSMELWTQIHRVALSSMKVLQDPLEASPASQGKALVVSLGEEDGWTSVLVQLLRCEGWEVPLIPEKCSGGALWEAIQRHRADLVVLYVRDRAQSEEVLALLARWQKQKKRPASPWVVTGRGIAGKVRSFRAARAQAVVNPLKLLRHIPDHRKPLHKQALRGDRSIAQRVGENILRERTSQKLTQAQLAKRIGVFRVYVAKVESGVQNVTLLQLVRFARGLGVRPSALLEGVE